MWCVKRSEFHAQSSTYSGKVSRENTFANFEVLWLFAKVFYAKFGDVASFGAKVFSVKIVFTINSRKFSSSKVSRYTVSELPTLTHSA